MLVTVFLRGGMDGLTAVAPYGGWDHHNATAPVDGVSNEMLTAPSFAVEAFHLGPSTSGLPYNFEVHSEFGRGQELLSEAALRARAVPIASVQRGGLDCDRPGPSR